MQKNMDLQAEEDALVQKVRSFIRQKELKKAEQAAAEGMQSMPHSPVPQNLMGLILEMEHETTLGLNHFRAALALDPSYEPARVNLDCFSSFFHGYCAFDDSDSEQIHQKEHPYTVEYDSDGLARVVRRSA